MDLLTIGDTIEIFKYIIDFLKYAIPFICEKLGIDVDLSSLTGETETETEA